MHGRQWGAGIMVAGMALISPPANGAQVDRPSLVIRAYIATPIRTADWKVAVREAAAILEDAGVEVGWIHCPADDLVTTALTKRCVQPLMSNEVAVRIVRSRTSAPGGDRPLGESLLDTSRRTGTLATIYLDRVEWLAGTGMVDATTVLARAIAHEIGHLLIGTAAHSQRGLMRPVWTRAELIRARAGDWVFPADDAARLRRGFERRVEPPPVPVAVVSTR